MLYYVQEYKRNCFSGWTERFRLADRVTAAGQREPRPEPTPCIQVNCCPLVPRLPLSTLC